MSALAFACCTDLRLHVYLDLTKIKSSSFDFTLIQNNTAAVNNVMKALVQYSILEQFTTLDIDQNQFVRNSKPTKETDVFVQSNKNQLLQLLQQQEVEDVSNIPLLLAALMFGDPHLEMLYKNPMNIKNHRLYRYMLGEGTMFSAHVELIIQRAAEARTPKAVQNA